VSWWLLLLLFIFSSGTGVRENKKPEQVHTQVKDIQLVDLCLVLLACAGLNTRRTIIHPATKSRLQQMSPVTAAAMEKRDNYADLYGPGKPHSEFVPLIFEAYGGFSEEARAFCLRVAMFAALSDRPVRQTAESMVDRIAIAIQRGNARTVFWSLRNAVLKR
jgi:hypothetical protein